MIVAFAGTDKCMVGNKIEKRYIDILLEKQTCQA